VKLTSVTNRLQSMITRARYISMLRQSSPLKTGLIVLCTIRNLISCELVRYRKICKGSYVSDNLRDNGTLIAGDDGNSFMVGSAESSTEISTRGPSISVGREEVSYNGTNSATTSDFGSSRTPGSTMIEGSGSASTFAMKGSVIG